MTGGVGVFVTGVVLALPLSIVSVASLAMDEVGIDELVITGKPLVASDMTQTAGYVRLSRSEIERLAPLSVVDLLNNIPGLYVSQNGGPGGVSSLHIRCAEANFTLIMLDGVPVNDPLDARGGTFDLARIAVQSIVAVEVIKGPQAALHRQGSVAGVVNIITQVAGKQATQVAAFAEGGTDSSYKASASVSGLWGNGHSYRISAGYQDLGKAVEGSRSDSAFAEANIRFAVMDEAELAFGVLYMDGKRTSFPDESGGPLFAVLRDLDRADQADLTLSARYSQDFSSKARLLTTLVWHRQNRDEQSPGVFPAIAIPPNGADSRFDRVEANITGNFELADYAHLTAGADYIHENGTSQGFLFAPMVFPVDFSFSRDTYSGFFDLRVRPVKRVTLISGLRVRDWQGQSVVASLFFGGDIALDNQGTVFEVHWGEAVKPASFFSLGHPLVGNPDLLPERADMLEFSLITAKERAISVSATFFFNDYYDLIDFDSTGFSLVNRPDVSSDGVDMGLDARLHESLHLSASVTYAKTRLNKSKNRLPQRPDWQQRLELRWQPTAAVSLMMAGQHIGKRLATSQGAGAVILPDAFRFDMRAHVRLDTHWSFTLSVDNVADHRYQEAVGFPVPGLQGRLGIRAEF